MKKLLTLILLILCALHLNAQSPEQVVREYVILMNQYFSTGNLDYRDKIVNEMLNPKDASGKRVTCRIDDKISQRILFQDGSTNDEITPSRYLAKLGKQNTDCNKCLRMEIMQISTKKGNGETFVSTKIKFSGSNGEEIIYEKFIILGNGISWIMEDKDAKLNDKRSNTPDNSSVIVENPVQNNQDTKNIDSNHEYIDLGLPSGTLWATCNVGANNPWEYGDYFAWGEITTKSSYSWSNYIFANGASNKLTKYCNMASYGNNGFTDSCIILEHNDDVAYQKWGSDWCMPTQVQWLELLEQCACRTKSRNGNIGIEVEGPNGNTIFLPQAGYMEGDGGFSDVGVLAYYWSSTLATDTPYYANSISFDYRSIYPNGVLPYRFRGQSVRPVCCKVKKKTEANKWRNKETN